MKARYSAVLVLMICFISCKKVADGLMNVGEKTTGFTTYTIKKNEHYCDKNDYKAVSYDQLSFLVLFDSSAVYQTQSPENQYDINKLFGFSDNAAQHHLYSARFGWRWSDGALRMFAYVYNNGIVMSQEIGTVQLNQQYQCGIQVKGNEYIFTLDKQTISMPRASVSAYADGYQLYPYFGGDETAPHDINIRLRQL